MVDQRPLGVQILLVLAVPFVLNLVISAHAVASPPPPPPTTWALTGFQEKVPAC